MKKIFGFILIIAGMILCDIYIMDWQPKYFILIILLNLFIVFCLIFRLILNIFFNNNNFDLKKTKKYLKKTKNLSKKKFEEIIVSVLKNCGYSNCEKAKKNPYGINYICDNTAFYIEKRKNPAGEILVKQLEECKDFFHVYSVCIITDAGYTEYAKEYAKTKGIFLWDMNRMIKYLDDFYSVCNSAKGKKHIHIENLDSCKNKDFPKLLTDLLKQKYEYLGEEENILLFKIDDRNYHIIPIKSDLKNKITVTEISKYAEKIQNEKISDIMIVSNGYYSIEVKDWSLKMKISLWNRDNLNFLIRSIK